jgi:hypothetical protein
MTLANTKCLGLLLAVLVPRALHADVVNVDCGAGGTGLQAAVNGLSSPTGPHTINVLGTCVENVTVNGVSFLTLQGSGGATLRSADPAFGVVLFANASPSMQVRGLNLDGASHDFAIGLYAFESDVRYQGGTIENCGDTAVFADVDSEVVIGGPSAGQEVAIRNNAAGPLANRAVLRIQGRTTVEDNDFDALVSTDSTLTVSGPSAAAGNVFRNNGFGIAIIAGGTAGFSGLVTIEDNGPYGILASRVPQVSLAGRSVGGTPLFTTIQGHTQNGVLVSSSTFLSSAPAGIFNLVRNNGSDPVTTDAGVLVIRPGALLARSLEVSNNIGPGVLLDAAAYGNFATARISGNSGDGIRVLHNSTAEFGAFAVTGETIPADTAVSGNGGEAIACDDTAVVFGDLDALPKVKCKVKDGRPRGGSAAAALAEIESRLGARMERRPRPRP